MELGIHHKRPRQLGGGVTLHCEHRRSEQRRGVIGRDPGNGPRCSHRNSHAFFFRAARVQPRCKILLRGVRARPGRERPHAGCVASPRANGDGRASSSGSQLKSRGSRAHTRASRLSDSSSAARLVRVCMHMCASSPAPSRGSMDRAVPPVRGTLIRGDGSRDVWAVSCV